MADNERLYIKFSYQTHYFHINDAKFHADPSQQRVIDKLLQRLGQHPNSDSGEELDFSNVTQAEIDALSKGRELVKVDTSTSAVTHQFEAADEFAGHLVAVVDQSTNAGTNAITVSSSTGDTIHTISLNGGYVQVWYDGSQWWVVSELQDVSGTDSGSYLEPANNLSDIDSALTARGNLGLGSAATVDESDLDSKYLQTNNKLGEFTDLTTVRSNLGLGDAATSNSGDFAAAGHDHDTTYAKQSSNLGDLDNATSARSNLGLGDAATSSASDFAAASHNHDSRYMQPGDNLSGLGNKSTARSNLGLGDAATSSTSDFAASGHLHDSRYLQQSNNLSDIADKTAARESLNLGTAATSSASDFASAGHSHSNYLDQSQNLGDVSDASAARTNLDVYSKSEVDNLASSGDPELLTIDVTGNHTISSADVILINSAGADGTTFNLELGAAKIYKGAKATFRDIGMNAATSNINITTDTGQVENTDGYIIENDGGKVTLISDGTNWWMI